MSINLITSSIENLFKTIRKPLQSIPAVLSYGALTNRPGLSTIISSGNIIRSQSDFGAITDATLPDGTPNMMNALIVKIVDEVYRALREDSRVDVSIAPNSITTMVTGANGGGPFTANGTNISFGSAYGNIR